MFAYFLGALIFGQGFASSPISAATVASTQPPAVSTAAAPHVVPESAEDSADLGFVSHMTPFQEPWEEATPDEKALFLEVYAETNRSLQEQWDQLTPEDRRKALKNHPLLSARPLKHHWVSAPPEEREAFLQIHPKAFEKLKEGWNGASPEQRLTLAKEHPYLARRGLFHGWDYATPQEKIAYLDAHPDFRAQLRSRWINATPQQKEWYEQNYAGLMDVLARGKRWSEMTLLDRAAFLDANPGIMSALREEWQKSTPEQRAQLVRKWAGWPLRELTTKSSDHATADVIPARSKKKYRNLGPKI